MQVLWNVLIVEEVRNLGGILDFREIQGVVLNFCGAREG